MRVPGYCLELPPTDYHDAWALQQTIVAAKAGRLFEADVVLLLEHPPVFTLGRRGGVEHLTVSQSLLEKANIQVVQVERGGNITYHGPGQVVVYPILDLKRLKLGITELVSGMEDIMMRSAREFGVTAERDARNRGVWVGNRKLGSIGIAVRKGISFHGFAFNVNPLLKHFQWIHPCGLTGVGVTSLAKELGDAPAMGDVVKAIRSNLEKVFGFELQAISKDRLTALIKPFEKIQSDPLTKRNRNLTSGITSRMHES